MSKENLAAADRIYHEWDAALASNDVEALLALYHKDAIIESPLIPYIMGIERGICQGTDEIFHRWRNFDVGISQTYAQWRTNGFC
jgi:ketosteroid isomerase-like protein